MILQSYRMALVGALYASIMMACLACAPAERSNLGVEQLKGTSLTGEKIRFADVKGGGVVLNFYSPTCKPCIDELPALNHYYDEARKHGVAMFIALEPDLEKNGIENGSETDEAIVHRLLSDRMKLDVAKYHIHVPVVILDRPFSIRPDGLVTGTPETMLFRTNPFRLFYNFIGPLSSATTDAQLARSSRYSFALMKLNEIMSTGQASPRSPGY